jgi:hypothetical protein
MAEGISFQATTVETVSWDAGGLHLAGQSSTRVVETAIPTAAAGDATQSRPAHPDEAKLRAREASGAGAPTGSSLFETLTARREAADALAKEEERQRYRPLGLDVEEAAFLEEQSGAVRAAALAASLQASEDKAAFEEAAALAAAAHAAHAAG